MIRIDRDITLGSVAGCLDRFFALSASKIRALEDRWDPKRGTPVFTDAGKYSSRGWTEWTQGFQFGSSILQFDATGEPEFLENGRRSTLQFMALHVSHIGVHDHGFNNVSTYGNLLRLMSEGRIESNPWEKAFYEIALKVSGAIQAARWTDLGNDEGFIYSFNGPHSLFADTIRSLRSLAIAHHLGHALVGEKDSKISLLHRLIRHAETTARYNVYFGRGRDIYDVRGRVAHESIFNVNDGSYRCPNTQQGYSPFSTWTRGLAWILCGFAEQLEYVVANPLESELQPYGGRDQVVRFFEEVAVAVADFYIDSSPTDGIPYWDTGAPGLAKLGDYLSRPADPYNEFEPVDSSAAAIAAQGLLRLGLHFNSREERSGDRYFGAGLKIAQTLLDQPYLSIAPEHEGLLLHSVYHRPNGWDYIPPGKKAPQGEASMWGDYHARELALFLLRFVNGQPYYRFCTT